jgi:hypothetical protein
MSGSRIESPSNVMPHLLTVGGARIPLHGGHAYVLGRSPDCHVVVDDTACSRWHARIVVGRRGDVARLENLGSRNGTFLDGIRVESKAPLRHGGRVGVGATVLLFKLAEDALEEDLSDTRTWGFESAAFAEQIESGELANYGALDLLRLLLSAGRDVTLHVAIPGDRIEVCFRGQAVVSARCGGLGGFNALVKLGRAESGIFWVVEESTECVRNVQEPASRLFAELARCLGCLVSPG